MNETNSPVLKIKQLKTAYFGPIDLEVMAGECAAIMGPSGAGKSLMLRAIVDLDVSTGDVVLDDRNRKDMGSNEWRRLVGFVPAESGWWADRVGDHFLDQENTRQLLSDVGLGDSFDWEISRLSTGERHRLAIARAIQVNPKVLLLDEPTAALDDDATKLLEGIFRQLLDAGIAIVLVTHDPAQADRLGDRHFLINDGTLQETEGVSL